MNQKSINLFMSILCINLGQILQGQNPALVPELAKPEISELEKAIQEYERLKQKYPDKKDLNFNLGNLKYYQGDFSSAADEYKSSLSSEDEILKSHAHYNLGNTLYKNGEMEQSLEQYRKAIELNPDDFDARHNYEFVKFALQQQQKEQQNQNNENQDSENQEQKQDQESQSEESQNEESEKQESESQNQDSGEDEQKEKNEQEQSDSQEENDEEQQQRSGEESEKEQGEEESQPQPQQQEMTPEQLLEREEAEAILNTLKASEQNLMKRIYKTGKRIKVLKDW